MTNLTDLSHILLYRNHFAPTNDPDLTDKEMHVWLRDNLIMNVFSKEKEQAIRRTYNNFPYSTFRQFWEHNIKSPDHQDVLEWKELRKNPYVDRYYQQEEGTYLMLMYLWHEVKSNPWEAKPVCLKIGESQNVFKRVVQINSSRSYGLFGVMIGKHTHFYSSKGERLCAEDTLRDALLNDFNGNFYEGMDYISIPNIENYNHRELYDLINYLEM